MIAFFFNDMALERKALKSSTHELLAGSTIHVRTLNPHDDDEMISRIHTTL